MQSNRKNLLEPKKPLLVYNAEEKCHVDVQPFFDLLNFTNCEPNEFAKWLDEALKTINTEMQLDTEADPINIQSMYQVLYMVRDMFRNTRAIDVK